MTPSCRDIIVGSLLGDACLERNGKNVRLRIDHGQHQEALVDWKYQGLQELNPSLPRRIEVYDPRTQKTYLHFRFTTQTTEQLNPFFELFYPNGKKSIPDNIGIYLISALSMAVWYMDDGSRRGDCCGGYFNTQSCRMEEIILLRDCLLKNFQLVTKTHYAAGRPRIYIGTKQFPTFCELIRPYVIPEMRYKLL